MNYVLETNNLEKKYKDFKALSHTNIHIERGSIYGLIGKNGAGKTTLIRIICGLQKPTNGDYTIYGVSNTCKEISNIRNRIGAIIESPSIYGEMTARDNLITQSKLVGLPNLDEIDELLKLVDLSNTGKKKAKNFSLGTKQRLGIAIALTNNPDFLILDEPINGLDPQGIIEIRELILKLNKEKGITILISSHYLDELSKIATNYGFLDKGTLIKEISSKDLMKQMQHKIVLKVNNEVEFVKYLEKNKISYEVIDAKTIEIYEKINLSQFIYGLSQKNLEVEEIHEKEETLETYYMNLIGGKENV